MMYPKQNYVRSKELLRLIASLDCQHCGASGQTQAAHSNWHESKGRAIKASDQYAAAMCIRCHSMIDQGASLTKAERREIWERAHHKTVMALGDRWSANVPKPETKHLIF
jgi:phage terminase large subunit GpA-like protein